MNIDDINIYKIIEDYLEYIYIMESLNLEIATEFITMASMLIYLKSKKILPKASEEQEDDEISEEALKEKIIKYKKYKEASKILEQRYEKYNYRVNKKREELKGNSGAEVVEKFFKYKIQQIKLFIHRSVFYFSDGLSFRYRLSNQSSPTSIVFSL